MLVLPSVALSVFELLSNILYAVKPSYMDLHPNEYMHEGRRLRRDAAAVLRVYLCCLVAIKCVRSVCNPVNGILESR